MSSTIYSKYQRWYDHICLRGRQDRDLDYSELHHITPRCLGGDDSIDNLTRLTGREHFLVHWLLVKIYQHTPHVYKLSSSFNKMCQVSEGQQRNNSHLYHYSRKLFSKHHPCKQEEVVSKIKTTLYKTLEEKRRLHEEKNKIEVECEREGCYNIVIQWKTRKKNPKYCSNTCSSKDRKPPSEETRRKTSLSLRKTLSTLTEDQMRERLKKSLLNCDQVERGRKISQTKRKNIL